MFFATPNLVKVGDFGFSTMSKMDGMLNTFCGSPPYAAPELFKDDYYAGVFVDIWALGIMLFFMVTGVMPFRAETVAKLKKVILEGIYTVPSFVSTSCRDLINSILIAQPDQRLPLTLIKQSDWLEGQEFPEALPAFRSVLPENLQLTFEETEARDTLTSLGITQEHFREAYLKDSRSHVTGTHRIVLDRISKRNRNEGNYTQFGDAFDRASQRSRQSRDAKRSSTQEKQSKMCSIL